MRLKSWYLGLLLAFLSVSALAAPRSVIVAKYTNPATGRIQWTTERVAFRNVSSHTVQFNASNCTSQMRSIDPGHTYVFTSADINSQCGVGFMKLAVPDGVDAQSLLKFIPDNQSITNCDTSCTEWSIPVVTQVSTGRVARAYFCYNSPPLATIISVLADFYTIVRVNIYDKDGNLIQTDVNSLAPGPAQFTLSVGGDGLTAEVVSDLPIDGFFAVGTPGVSPYITAF